MSITTANGFAIADSLEIGYEVAQRIKQKGESLQSVEEVAQCVESS